jgi:hypothetical protein
MERIVTLKAKSNHGRNRIHVWGDQWVVTWENQWRIMCHSLHDLEHESTRNVNKISDPDFEISP